MTRRYDPRRARPHRNYTRLELAEVFDVALAAICAWKRKGLEPIDNRRPYLFAGADVRAFLERHNKPRQPTGPNEMYCVSCKRVTRPAGDEVNFKPLSSTSGDLIGRCPRCSRRMFQRVRKDQLGLKTSNLVVRYEDDSTTVTTGAEPPRTELRGKGAP